MLLVNLSKIFARKAARLMIRGTRLSEGEHPLDTHPALSRRLEAMAMPPEGFGGVSDRDGAWRFVEAPASALVPDVSRIEEELSVGHQRRLAEALGLPVPTRRARARRCARRP